MWLTKIHLRPALWKINTIIAKRGLLLTTLNLWRDTTSQYIMVHTSYHLLLLPNICLIYIIVVTISYTTRRCFKRRSFWALRNCRRKCWRGMFMDSSQMFVSCSLFAYRQLFCWQMIIYSWKRQFVKCLLRKNKVNANHPDFWSST